MTVWIALLRGVNVGGGNRIPMAELRAAVESLGYGDVATYIQSGNVVFRSDDAETVVVDHLRRVLADRHGLGVPVVVRTAHELSSVAGRHPFDDGSLDPKYLHVAFLDRSPETGDVPGADDWAPDRWAVDGRELFLAYPEGSGRSRMTIERFEQPWGVTATARNLNTVAKIVELASTIRDH